jgi:hypothetical protein
MRDRIWTISILFSFALWGCVGSDRSGIEKLYTLTINSVKLNVEIVRTPRERARGLMFRKSLPQDQGMLFIYEGSDIRGFWMKDTYIPLSLAYIDENCRIIQLVDMEPLERKSYPSASPAQFVLEVNRGWFEKNNVKVGDIVENIPGASGN